MKMTNIELANEINNCPVWDRELLTELCERAGLSEEFELIRRHRK